MGNGIIWVRYEKELEIKHLKKFYQDKVASQTFINHCIVLFEFFLQLKREEENSNETIEINVETKTEMWIYQQKHPSLGGDFEEAKNYLSDLYWERLKNPINKNISSSTYFLELLDPRMPQYAIKYRIKQYIKLKEEGKWKYYSGLDGKFPSILLIFPNQQKINFLNKFIREQLESSYDSEELIFRVTTCKKAITEGVTNSKIWQEIKEK